MPRKILRTKSISGLIGSSTIPGEEFFNTTHPTGVTDNVGMLVQKVECILDAEFVKNLLSSVRFEFSISEKILAPTEIQTIDDDGCIFAVQAVITNTSHPIIFVWDAPPKGSLVVADFIQVSIYVGVVVDGLNARWRISYVDTPITASERNLVIP
jgi:hypothetical protein